jgi:hypothetical protein
LSNGFATAGKHSMKGVARAQPPVEQPLERLATRILEHQHNPIDESQHISYGAFARLSVRELIFRAGAR